MTSPPAPLLDPSSDDFRQAGHRLIDWIADHFERIDETPVMARVEPGDVARQFRPAASEEGRSYDSLIREFETAILPGVTHWNHPGFFAYFSVTGSKAGILGELLSAALNINGMIWKSCPAATELETVVLAWLRKALGLPDDLFGIINDTASINTFLALAAARESLALDIRGQGTTGRTLPLLKIYCSEQAHSSVEKSALALGLGSRGVTLIPAGETFEMSTEALAEAIATDRAEGHLPCAIVATIGTTATSSIDPLEEIADIARKEGIWLHVDAAYAGSAMICPELRSLWKGVEHADSIVVNPHKWLFTPIDCSVLLTRKPEILAKTFSLVPDYLKTTDSAAVNYMDYGLQLGRRFRALKLWMVMEYYGLERMRSVIRAHVEWGGRLAALLGARPDVELLAPQVLSVVVFRKIVRDRLGKIDDEASEMASIELVERANASGAVFLSTTRLRGVFAIRVAIGNGMTEWRHVERILDFVEE
ncbi:MAG TPA: pyridoxal-dependent decarboxylase [Thermoanaerobaculia bacterium]|nr:pyridoxal-dependent decarboxylase [Thermoanaerobaculia bacterium]